MLNATDSGKTDDILKCLNKNNAEAVNSNVLKKKGRATSLPVGSDSNETRNQIN